MAKRNDTPTLYHDGKLDSVGSFGTETWNINKYPQNWQAFTKSANRLYYQAANIGFTVRKEKRSETLVWYGYKKVAGKLFNVYVGAYIDLNILNQAADKLLEKISIREETASETNPKVDKFVLDGYCNNHQEKYMTWLGCFYCRIQTLNKPSLIKSL